MTFCKHQVHWLYTQAHSLQDTTYPYDDTAEAQSCWKSNTLHIKNISEYFILLSSFHNVSDNKHMATT